MGIQFTEASRLGREQSLYVVYRVEECDDAASR